MLKLNSPTRRIILATVLYIAVLVSIVLYTISTYDNNFSREDWTLETEKEVMKQLDDFFAPDDSPDEYVLHSVRDENFVVEFHSVSGISRKDFELTRLEKYEYTNSWQLAYGNVAILTLGFLAFLGAVEFSVWSVRTVRKHRLVPSEDVQVSALRFLLQEAARAEARANELQARSTLMLIVGIAMAFVGVAVFALTIPKFDSSLELKHYIVTMMRPFAMLVFVEGVAWFLLRQYRALIEDYKAFYAVYLKRSDFLAAALLLSTDVLAQEDRDQIDSNAKDLLARYLLKERIDDVKTLLNTSGIEREKATIPNEPIHDLIRAMIDKIPSGK